MKMISIKLVTIAALLVMVSQGRHHHHGGGGRGGGSGGCHHNPPPGSHSPSEGAEQDSFDNAAAEAKEYRTKLRNKEKELSENNEQLNSGSPGGRRHSLGRVRPALLRFGQKSSGIGRASSRMKDDNHDPDHIYYGGTSLGQEVCLEKPNCTEGEPYRTMDGSCNNIDNGLWGMAGTPFIRLLDPDYGDKHHRFAPRKAKDKNKLPSARRVSKQVFPGDDVADTRLSFNAMQMGQFLDHDITHTPLNSILNDDNTESAIQCCQNGRAIGKDKAHDECFAIKNYGRNDPLLTQYDQDCMEFVRSLSAPDNDCLLKARQQMNALTHWVDASQIYGSSDEEANELRTLSLGLLKSQSSDGKDILPAAESTDACPTTDDGKACFLAGDARVNEQVGLTMMHTIWMREHNRVAKILSTSMDEDDEKIYQMTRRIVVAEWQHIVYNEYLRVVLGSKFLQDNDMDPMVGTEYPFFNGYNSSVDPSISNSFATAAYRFGHSMVRDMIQFYREDGENYNNEELKDIFFKPQGLYDSTYRDGLCRGLGRSFSQKLDGRFTAQIKDHLFESEPGTGLDLVSLNIQRGRDHGLPGYNQYRKKCGLPTLKSFEEFRTAPELQLTIQTVDELKRLFRDVDDVDLFVGGISEQKPDEGGEVGPTFQCLIGEQFERLKKGDRYFYDSASQPFPFTEPQLSNIKASVSLAGIMCANADNVEKLQKDIFIQADTTGDDLVDCKDIPQIDLNLFMAA